MSKALNYFVGRICTVFTTPINRNFKEENPATYPQQLVVYFTGVVDAVDDTGITLSQLDNGLKSYFFRSHIIGIAEEEVLDPSKPEDQAKINQMQTLKDEPPAMVTTDNPAGNPLIDLNALEEMNRKLQS
jgi:hypothetical protein